MTHYYSIKKTEGHWHPEGHPKSWGRYARTASDMRHAVDLCHARRTVIQAGGNIGAWPVWLSNEFSTVITFEPDETNYVCLKKNTEHIQNIFPHRAALSAKEGFMTLKLSKSIGSHHLTNEPGPVRVTKIDSHAHSPVDLIVLDVEGAEYDALTGGLETIREYRPIIHMEDRNHGINKGFGRTYQDILNLLPEYKEALRVGRDVVLEYRG